MYLFGSRSPISSKRPRPDSDIDIFIESEDELRQIPSRLLAVNGGPIDAFWYPETDWAFAVGDDRQLLCWDEWGCTVQPIQISIREVLSMAASVAAAL